MCRKTRVLLSFLIVHPTSMMREAIALLLGMLSLGTLLHRRLSECSATQVGVSIAWSPNHSLIKLTVKRHLTKRRS